MKLLHLDHLPLLFTIDRNCGTHETPETASGGQTGLACAIQMTHFSLSSVPCLVMDVCHLTFSKQVGGSRRRLPLHIRVLIPPPWD